MNVFTFIKEHVTIVDVINSYTTLKKTGGYWKGHCPFHGEKTASFTVSPHKNIFYCFGCHSGGDIITFISKIEHCTSIQAVQFLADRYKIDISSFNTHTPHQNADERNQYWQACTLFAQWAHEQLLKTPLALDYLHKRALSPAMLTHFTIGYVPSSFKSLLDRGTKHSVLLQDFINAGLLAGSKTTLYSPFEDRIIFPITDHAGRPCGFGGRIFKETDQRAKYVNSKENNNFSKGSLLFGLDKARAAIQQQDRVFLVEGYLDCISMAQYGYSPTVATLGTACTAEQLKQLSRFTDNVYVLYDGDQAGQKAMLRLAELCWQVSIELKVIILPPNQDPNSFLSSGNDLAPLIEKAYDIFDFFIEYTAKDFSDKTLHEKVSIARKIITVIEKIDDPLKQDILLHKLAKSCDISYASLKQELKQVPQRYTKKEPIGVPAEPPLNLIDQLKEISELEKKLFSVIINDIGLLKPEDEHYIFSCIHPLFQNLLTKLKKIQGEEPSYDFSIFFEHLSDDEQHIISQLLLEFHEYSGIQNYESLIAQFQKKHWKYYIQKVKNTIDQAQQTGQAQEVKKIITNFQQLKQKLVAKGLI